MITISEQQRVANFMGAMAQLLGGHPGRHAEFIDKVELIVSGAEPHILQLMQFSDQCRTTGRPVLWVHIASDVPNVPQIGLVAPIDGQARVFENCMLWTGTGGGRAVLVPDSFEWGAYRFDDELRLRHAARSPARSFETARTGMIRAYNRLLGLQVELAGQGGVERLPELLRAA